jgi:mannan endo-1,4-beta-mannosidase
MTGSALAQAAPDPVTPNATIETRALLHAIQHISGRNTLSGQHNLANTESLYSNRASGATGKWPAIWSSDFGFAAAGDNTIYGRSAMILEAERQYNLGSIISLTWRAVRPTDTEPAGLKDSVQAKLTDEQWKELLTSGTSLRTRWEAQVDVIAEYLKLLRDAHVPVLWRPYPESNAADTWWSGRAGDNGSAALYKLLFDRLATRHQLNNLIWVWTAGASATSGAPESYYPGAGFCDILAAANHGKDYPQSLYDSITKLASGKPIALGEIDTAPTAATLAQQPLWTWFLLGAETFYSANQPGPLLTLFADPRVVHRGNPLFQADTLQTPEPPPCEPVNPRATKQARSLLKTLCSISGRYILSGQHNFPNHLSQHSDDTAGVAGKYPMIWGSDFGFTGGADKDSIEGRSKMIEEARRQYKAGSIITLMWHAVRPVDDEPVPPGIGWMRSIQNKLSDFEWQELITEGTEINQHWQAQIDVVARYLKQLQRARIPVLWRPYHEANGDWFWWGGRAGENGYIKLYRMTYDRLVNYHHLNNLIWVWNSNAPNGKTAGPYADFYPGRRFCDVLATDVYGEFKQSYHDELASIGNGIPIALGEIGAVPTPSILKSQMKWTWFMVWADLLNLSKPETVRELFSDPHTLSRGETIP